MEGDDPTKVTVTLEQLRVLFPQRDVEDEMTAGLLDYYGARANAFGIDTLKRRAARRAAIVKKLTAGGGKKKTKTPAAADDGKKKKKKKKTLVRFDKRVVEFKMSLPPPGPYRRMSDERMEKLGFSAENRAMEYEMEADARKRMDRDAEMRRQYAMQGYADIELTDVEEEEEEDDEEEQREDVPAAVGSRISRL